jgi:hypothetical protein
MLTKLIDEYYVSPGSASVVLGALDCKRKLGKVKCLKENQV